MASTLSASAHLPTTTLHGYDLKPLPAVDSPTSTSSSTDLSGSDLSTPPSWAEVRSEDFLRASHPDEATAEATTIAELQALVDEEFKDYESPYLRYDDDEPLLQGEPQLSALPISHDKTHEAYCAHKANLWSVEEIMKAFTSKDDRDWKALTKKERFAMSVVLLFFSVADGLVNMNLTENFTQEVTCLSLLFFYRTQMFMEDIHNLSYALLAQHYIPKESDRSQAQILKIPAIQSKLRWALRFSDKKRACFAERILAWCAVEMIHFRASFGLIFKFKDDGKLDALSLANELIARDEGLHGSTAAMTYRERIKNKLPIEHATKILTSACESECEFARYILKDPIRGLNADMMVQHIQYITDCVLVDCGLERVYYVENPLDFMEAQTFDGHTNFFEKQVGEYGAAKGAADSLLLRPMATPIVVTVAEGEVTAKIDGVDEGLDAIPRAASMRRSALLAALAEEEEDSDDDE